MHALVAPSLSDLHHGGARVSTSAGRTAERAFTAVSTRFDRRTLLAYPPRGSLADMKYTCVKLTPT